jgi:DNA-binding response OmpR family regulator
MSGGRTVLIVDDEPALVRVLAMHLDSEGYDVLTATNGPEALAQARQGRPQIVILDAMMPEMSGLEVCRRLRKDAELKRTHVIILTANEGFKQSAEEAGADDFMTKPFHLHDLSAALERVPPEAAGEPGPEVAPPQ